MPSDDVPLIFSSLSTRRLHYPRWLMLKSAPTPLFIRRSDVGSEACNILISSRRSVAVPSLVNDIADSLPWLLAEAPCLLRVAYHGVAVSLGLVCDFRNPAHIHPYDAHLKLTLVAMSNVMRAYCPVFHPDALDLLRSYLETRWGDLILFAGFKNILVDSYRYIRNRKYFYLHFF
jgi:hypothetical protein